MEDTATKPLEPRWKKSKWQNTEDKRREKARPPNPTPTDGVGLWAAISAIGLWIDEKRLLALVFAPKARNREKVGKGRKSSPEFIATQAECRKDGERKGSWREKRRGRYLSGGQRGEFSDTPPISSLGTEMRGAPRKELAHLTHQAGFRLAESATGGARLRPPDTPAIPPLSTRGAPWTPVEEV